MAFARANELTPTEALLRAEEIADIPKRQQTALTAFGRLIAKLRDEATARELPDLLDHVIEATGYGTYLKDGT